MIINKQVFIKEDLRAFLGVSIIFTINWKFSDIDFGMISFQLFEYLSRAISLDNE